MAFSKIGGKGIDVSTDIITEFNSTGVDDNATATTITLHANNTATIPNVTGNTTFDEYITVNNLTVNNDASISNDLTVGGNFIITGNTFTVDADSLKVEDSLIHLAGNNVSNDIIDIGFIGHYSNDSGNTELFTGFYRDATDEEYYLFNGLSDDINTATTIDKTGTGYTLASLNVGNLNTNGIFTIGDRGSATEELTIFHENNVSYLISDSSAGGGSKGEFSFRTNDGGTAAERVRIDGDGNVGVGTSSPNLHGWVKAITLNTSSNAGYELGQSGTKYGAFALQGDGRVQMINFTSNPLVFLTDTTERMRIDGDGTIGVGVTPNSLYTGYWGIQVQNSLWFTNSSNFSGFTQNAYYDGNYKYTTSREASLFRQINGTFQFVTAAAGTADDAITFDTVMQITNDGKVGIGTSPSNFLHVDKDTGSTPTVYINNSGPNITEGVALKVQASGRGTGVADASIFSVHNNTTELFTVRNDGNVGIATTSPLTALHVGTTGGNSYSSTITKSSNMKGGIFTQASNGDDMVGVYFATGSTTEGTHWSGITGSRSDNAAHWGTQLNFYTHDHNVANLNDATQKMVIKGDGKVGIGTTSPNALLDVDSGAPSSSDLTLGIFRSQTSRQIGFVWDDSQSTLGIATLTNHDIAFHTGGNSNEKARITQRGNIQFGSHLSSKNVYLSNSTPWIKIFERHYIASSFAYGQQNLLVTQSGSTNGHGSAARIHINMKQQGTGDHFDIQYVENVGAYDLQVAYYYDATGGNDSEGLLTVWVRPAASYTTISVTSTSTADNPVSTGETMAVSTGSSTQPANSVLLPCTMTIQSPSNNSYPSSVGIGTTAPPLGGVTGSGSNDNFLAIGDHTTTSKGILQFNGSTAGKFARMFCSNGNVHLDVGSGHGLYLNWYTSDSYGTGSVNGVYFGNGSSGQVGLISGAGTVYFPTTYTQTVTGRDVYIASNGQLGYLSSVREHKTNITSLTDVSWIYNLNPVKFNYKRQSLDEITEELIINEDEHETEISYGLIADEVANVNSDFVFYDDNDSLAGVEYKKFTAVLIKAIQDQKETIDNLQSRIEALESA